MVFRVRFESLRCFHGVAVQSSEFVFLVRRLVLRLRKGLWFRNIGNSFKDYLSCSQFMSYVWFRECVVYDLGFTSIGTGLVSGSGCRVAFGLKLSPHSLLPFPINLKPQSAHTPQNYGLGFVVFVAVEVWTYRIRFWG